MGWLYLIGIVVVLLLFPYLRIFQKRLWLAAKINKSVKKSGCRFVPTHSFWMFGRKHGSNCDFYVETRDKIYSVKLFSVKKRTSSLVFLDDSKYFIRKHFALSSYGGVYTTSFDGKSHVLPKYNFKYRFAENWYLKDFVPVLLVHPICHQIRQRVQRDERDVSIGDLVNGVFVYSLSRFLSMIEYEVDFHE